jgi:hypothetical protein
MEAATSRTPNTAQTASRVDVGGLTQGRDRTKDHTRCMPGVDTGDAKREKRFVLDAGRERATNYRGFELPDGIKLAMHANARRKRTRPLVRGIDTRPPLAPVCGFATVSIIDISRRRILSRWGSRGNCRPGDLDPCAIPATDARILYVYRGSISELKFQPSR